MVVELASVIDTEALFSRRRRFAPKGRGNLARGRAKRRPGLGCNNKRVAL
jgi:hypothetical protein